ncbi:anti-sigma factor domain-containing protein [Pusillimonas sp.]|uniref:anti-sigma factor domain-containing protein n=1 Tax=Pusillimonas sp. TaxID=3040095 RepID=UPI0037C89DBC
MISTHHKDDFFIAEYTLGLLEPDDIAQAHALLGGDDEAVVCALQWEARLLELTDALTPLHPPPQLLDRIRDTLALPRNTAAATPAIPPRGAAPASSVRPSAAPPSAPASPPPSHSVSPLAATPAQSGANIDFEPRLIRPDSVSSPEAAPPKTTAASQKNTGPVGSTAKSRSESALGAVPPKPDTPAETPARIRTAPSDPTEAFRREAASRRHPRQTFWRSLWFWRLLSGALAVLAVVLVLPENTFKHDPALSATLQPPTAPAPTVVQVAVMQAPGTSSTPGWILTVDSRQNVVLQPQVDIIVPESESVYLWTYSEKMPRPRLLGVIDPTHSLTLPMEVTGEVAPGQIFEMTQEPNLAVPSEPEGPILFIGRTVSLG